MEHTAKVDTNRSPTKKNKRIQFVMYLLVLIFEFFFLFWNNDEMHRYAHALVDIITVGGLKSKRYSFRYNDIISIEQGARRTLVL